MLMLNAIAINLSNMIVVQVNIMSTIMSTMIYVML